MAKPMSAATFVKILRAEGVNVAEPYSGWRTHNRNHKGAFSNVNGVVIHHTAGTNSLNFCYNGSSALPGPVCHTHLSKSGVASMMSAGRANHAGSAAANAFNAMLHESRTHPRPDAAEPIDANARTYGIEIENLGNGRDPYPAKQYDQAVRWAAAICRHYGWSEHSVVGHGELTRRKIDPSFDMNKFRADVAKRLATKPGASPVPPKENSDVPDFLSLGCTKSFKLDRGKWVSPAFDTEWADEAKLHAKGASTVGPGFYYTGFVHVRLSGLTPGKEVQVRIVEDDLSGKEKGVFPIGEGVGTEGDTFFTMPITGKCARSERIRVEIAQFGDSTATVRRVEFKAQCWKY